MNNNVLSGLRFGLGLGNIFPWLKYRSQFRVAHPDYFDPDGLLVFCGGQGSGKTLSAVRYVVETCQRYPRMILCANVDITGLPEHTQFIPYTGVECLSDISNGEHGVLFLIDELQLEFNSLESRNIPIGVITEICQQRKQRKHIVGTSQVFGRIAKPLREQINTAVGCDNLFGFIQRMTIIDGNKTEEMDGKLSIASGKTIYWVHHPKYYSMYDTYAKMRRFRDDWKSTEKPKEEEVMNNDIDSDFSGNASLCGGDSVCGGVLGMR